MTGPDQPGLRLEWGPLFASVGAPPPDGSNADAARPFDALLDEAAHTSDPESRRLMLEAAERVMLNDYPILPLYFFVSKRLVKPYVHGVQPNPLDRLTSKMLSMSTH